MLKVKSKVCNMHTKCTLLFLLGLFLACEKRLLKPSALLPTTNMAKSDTTIAIKRIYMQQLCHNETGNVKNTIPEE